MEGNLIINLIVERLRILKVPPTDAAILNYLRGITDVNELQRGPR